MFSKLRFSGFKKFVTRSVFEELQLTQISLNFQTSCCNLKIRSLGAKLCVACLFFNFERNHDFLKSKCPCILLSKNINFNKNERESKIENPTYSFRETNLVFQLLQESQIKSKIVMRWALERKKRTFFRIYITSYTFVVCF